jgi:hypothetical protein
MSRGWKRGLGLVAVWAGVNVAAGAIFRRRREAYAGSRRHFLLTHGGAEFRPSARELRDAVASVFMGGLVLDLRHLRRPMRSLHLDVRVVMGGLEVQVPNEWRVALEVRGTMGGVQQDRPTPVTRRLQVPRRPNLVITGMVTFGGLEITGE